MKCGKAILTLGMLIFVFGCGREPPPPQTPAEWLKSTAHTVKNTAESFNQTTKDIESVLKVAVPETAKTLGKVAKEAKQSIEESKGVIASAVETFNDELNK